MQVVAALQGHRPLPWEGEKEAAVQEALGVLYAPVLQLLQHDPSRRPSVQEFHNACTKAFSFLQVNAWSAR